MVLVVVKVVCSEAGQSGTKEGQAVSVWTSVTVTVDVVRGTDVVGGCVWWVVVVVVWMPPGCVVVVKVTVVSSSSSSSSQSSSSGSGICVVPDPAEVVVEVELVVVSTPEGGGLRVGV
jgi:hypothetical protein